jgi:hypothetical protein
MLIVHQDLVYQMVLVQLVRLVIFKHNIMVVKTTGTVAAVQMLQPVYLMVYALVLNLAACVMKILIVQIIYALMVIAAQLL